MKVIKGKVVSDISPTEDGSFWVETGKGEAVSVTYTSPSYNANNGGIFAPPSIDSYVLLFENENPQDGEPEFYYMATIVDDPPLSSDKRIKEFKAVRGSGPVGVYSKDKRPTGMTIANSDGQGLALKSDLSNGKRENYVALEAETGASISAGEQGCQLVNEHMDGIAIQGQPNGVFPYRSISMTAQGPILQEAGASFNITVGKGGDDINISNLANTLDLGGCGLSAGNIRIHSQNKDITLRTGSTGAIANPLATRNINIIAPGAEIQVNGTTGGVTIRSIGVGGLNLESATLINLNSPIVNVNGVLAMGGAGMSVSENTFTVDMPYVNINGQLQANFQSNAQANITSPATTVQGETVRVHSKTPAPPILSFKNSPGLPTIGVAPGSDAIVPPASLVPLPSLSTDPATLGIPGAPSVVVPNSYGDNIIV